uniref:Uncharacterized protein n=1 Tax=Bos indicus x Bos taurus TaxID=30522 RepID=A0A4W2INA3_BOBOX
MAHLSPLPCRRGCGSTRRGCSGRSGGQAGTAAVSPHPRVCPHFLGTTPRGSLPAPTPISEAPVAPVSTSVTWER